MSDDLSIPSPTYRIPRHRVGMDPLTRRLAIIACGLGGLLVVAIGGWTMLNRHGGSVPVVQAASGPMRVKPANPGGMQVAGANEDILSGDGPSGTDKLAPPPEVPDPQALRAPPKQSPAAVASAALPAPPPAIAAAQAPRPVTDRPLAAPDKHAAAAAVAAHTVPAGKDTVVQLAALRSEAAARDEWQRLQHRMPDLLKDHHPAISKVDHDGETLWRVRTGGFGDVAQATAFCERVRSKGAGCAVAAF